MKAMATFEVGDIVLPLPRHFSVCEDRLVLPDGVMVRHGDDFNVTIVSHFLVALKPFTEGAEVVLNLNLCFYDLLKAVSAPIGEGASTPPPHLTASLHFDHPAAPGFRYLEEEQKQELYRFADEQVRRQAIEDGFLPRGSDEDGLTVVRTRDGEPIAISTREHEEGEVVFEATGVPLPFPIRSTVELPGDTHLRLTGGSEFLRHSCLPNLRLEIDGTRIRGIALRPIEADEKLTYNYLTTEWEVSTVFRCSCNVYSCYGLIKGFRFLDREQQEHLLPHCSPAVCEKFSQPLLTGATLGALADGTGLFTTSEGCLTAQRDVEAGTILFDVLAAPRLERNELVLDGLRLHHSCDANAALVNGHVVASRPLAVGDAVTCNLNLFYYTLSPSLPCACGCVECTGQVAGFKALPAFRQNSWWSLVSSGVRAAAHEDGYNIVLDSSLAEVRRTPHMGDATFARHAVVAGTRIFRVRGLVVPFPTLYTVYLGEGKHLLFADGAQCLAHSCNPNTRMVVNAESGCVDCIALRAIAADEVLSFNYLTTEWDMSEPFACACGSADCYGRIAGFRHLRRDAQLRLWCAATPAVRSLFAQSIRQTASTLARLNSSLVAPTGINGALCLCKDAPSGVVLFEAASVGFTVENGHICFGDVLLAHSCGATAVLLEGRVVLSTACTAGTPITLNANQLCYEVSPSFGCHCGVAHCTNTIGGFSALSDDEKARILLCTAPDVRAESTAAGFMIPSACPLVSIMADGAVGQTTFAARRIPKGTRFFQVHGLILPFPTVYTIQLARGRHLQFADGAQCLAHSCDPNIRVVVDAESCSLDCLALRDIEVGERIAFNYLTTEWDMSTPFSCLCGAKNCFGRIGGLRYLSAEQRQRLWWMLTPAMRLLASSSPNWKALAGALLRADERGYVRAAKELKEGLPILQASQVQLQVGHAVVDGVKLRHSCLPTAAVIEGRVVTVETVVAGTEITLDLNCLGYVLEEPFTCSCAGEITSHRVTGFAGVSDVGRAARLIFTEPSVRAAALRDGYQVPCTCPIVEVHANGEMGQATFAAVNIPAGTRFLEVKGLCLPFPTMYTIMLGKHRHLLFADGAQCLAHSCRPNVRVRINAQSGALECQALQNIQAGELIAFNYNATEWAMNTPFRCLCGAPECVFEIRGFKYLSLAQRAALQQQATPVIKEMAVAYADVQLPASHLRAGQDGHLRSARAASKGAILLEVMYLDIQPRQVSVGRHYVIPHDAQQYNCVLVEGRLIASRAIAREEALSINMNFFVYDMTALFPHSFDENCKGFKYMEEKAKQAYLYLCEPPVRAQAMRDGWIVKSTEKTLVIRPNGDMGQTAYACKDIAAGTRLFHCYGLVVPFPTMYTICVGVHQHLLFGSAAECIAHHCDPNVMVQVGASGEETFDFVALRDIAAGEMVTFNYTTTEWDMNTPFVCLCGSPKCAGTIQGFKYLKEVDQQRLWPITSDVVKGQWKAYTGAS